MKIEDAVASVKQCLEDASPGQEVRVFEVEAVRALLEGREAVKLEIPLYKVNRGGTTRPVAIAVDFDGCVVANEWPGIGQVNMPLVKALKNYRSAGVELILWTCREGEALAKAVAFCKDHGLYFDAVNENLPSWREMFGNDTRKVGADYYIDDKAVCIKAGCGRKFEEGGERR